MQGLFSKETKVGSDFFRRCSVGSDLFRSDSIFQSSADIANYDKFLVINSHFHVAHFLKGPILE